MKKILLMLLLICSGIISAATLDLNNVFNYENQNTPLYIIKDNTTANNPITNLGATLGRVLFYDQKLSVNNTISCASCHHQEFAFGDTAVASVGFEGDSTGRHSTRLVNNRYASENSYFWDERANTLEDQVTMPIEDPVEMGFSGQNGAPGFDSLISKLNATSYYTDLFEAAFGTKTITKTKIQLALSQFVRSIESFDAKYDTGRALAGNDLDPFPNFSASENNGKFLFLTTQNNGGTGCGLCHRAPEFDIDPVVGNNGIIGVIDDPNAIDLDNTRAPSLRDVFNPDGTLNAPLMHTGEFTSMLEVINHYNLIPQDTSINSNLDSRLIGYRGDLQLTASEKTDLINFLKTLSGTDVYTNPKWSDPFDNQGNITVTPLIGAALNEYEEGVNVFPNPFTESLSISTNEKIEQIKIYTMKGQVVPVQNINDKTINLSHLQGGIYIVEIVFENKIKVVKKVIKE